MHPLIFCKNLKVLGIFGNQIKSVYPVIHMKLQQFSIRDNPLQAFNWLYFSMCKELNTLWIYSTPLIAEKDSFSKLKLVLKENKMSNLDVGKQNKTNLAPILL
jgi:hypothetical protein